MGQEMKRIVLWALGGLGAAAVATAGFYGFGTGDPEPTQGFSDAPSLESVLPNEETQAGGTATADPTVTTAAAQPASKKAAREAEAERTLAFRRLQINTSGDAPEACLAFSEDLSTDESVRLKDYLEVSPSETQYAVRVAGPLLCLGGLEFGKSYTVTIRSGLPGASGRKTLENETIPVELRNRPAAVSFGSGLILPRESSDGVPLNTVNVERVDIQVFQVNDRLLSQLETGLIDETVLYGWNINRVENDMGALTWEGSMGIANQSNQTVRTLFPIRDVLPQSQPGVYLVLARDAALTEEDREYRQAAAQWVVDSDLGLTTFSGSEGLHVFVRSLNSAEPLSNAKVTLIARNNAVLGTATTGSDGSVRFDPGLIRGTGGMTPVMVMVYRDEDFMFLDLRRRPFDLSDRGVSGRPEPDGTDAFVYLDRGIYRPGETVQIVAMVRDSDGVAAEDVPLTIILRRPDGVEYRRVTVAQQTAGSVHVPLTLSRSAARGQWRVNVHLDPARPPVGTATFDVQDFVPERLEVTLKSDAEYLRLDEPFTIAVNARYLYDAPGRNLGGNATVRVVSDPAPYKDFGRYSFGLVQETFSPKIEYFDVPVTNARGDAKISGSLPQVGQTSKSLRADFSVNVAEPSGRTTSEQISLPIRSKPVALGIRPAFEGGWLRRNTPARFDVVALNEDGERIALEGLEWRFIRERVHYDWYQDGNAWRYRRIVRDVIVDDGTLDVDANQDTAQTFDRVSWGSYRFEVRDLESGAASSFRFYSGWYGASSGDAPDRVRIISDRETYKAGDVARITIEPPMAGKALITVASDKVHETRTVDVPEDGRALDLIISPEWGSGVYVMVNLFRPMNSDASAQVPVRAIGLTHLSIDQSGRTLTVEMETPDVASPQRLLDVPVKVVMADGSPAPSGTFVTLAAVDQGILNLTGFEPPRPEDHYFGKRRLGVEIRDDYGRLIRGAQGTVGEIRSGGDGFGNGGALNVVPIKTVALFSGIVALDDTGSAVIPLSVPDFAGELNLMAVAFAGNAVGHGAGPLTVRADVVGELTLPRFLAPGDEANATLQIDNVAGAAGQYTAVIKTTGSLGETETVLDGPDLMLEQGGEARLSIPVTGETSGLSTVTLTVTGPRDFTLEREWAMEVRPPRLARADQQVGLLEPGTSLDYGLDVLDGLMPETAAFTLSVATSRGYDVPGLLKSLSRYPFGCLEQTTSRAFPLLYFNDLAQVSGLDEDEDLNQQIQEAIDRVLDYQRPDGAFGMWSRNASPAYPWLSVFALDFLVAAKAQGHIVPADAIRRGNNWLNTLTRSDWMDINARVYGFYVLAKQGEAYLPDLRYLFDTRRGTLESAVSHALMGAALDLMGDRARGRIAFVRAMTMLEEPVSRMDDRKSYVALRYGTYQRDLSALIALAAESGRTEMLASLFEIREKTDSQLRYLNTQEKVWMLLAAHHLNQIRERTVLSVSVEGAEQQSREDGSILVVPSSEELSEGVRITNTGDSAIWYAATAEGVPAEPEPAQEQGMRLEKTLLTLDGAEVGGGPLQHGERYIVLLQGQTLDILAREMGLLDLLPAGLEIETILPAGDPPSNYAFLPRLTFTLSESARDDRFVSMFRLRGSKSRSSENAGLVFPDFALAYVVRAITPGTFALPAAKAEDMYSPRIMARTQEREITIVRE